jgi:hypothetical protein
MNNITAVVVTSVLPSHPSTAVIDETIASIRHHLPDSEIILQIDGLRAEQQDRLDDYNEYKTRILWKCLHQYKNVLPVIFEEHSHQSDMMRETIDLIKTPMLLYVEGDTPLVTDEDIDWEKCTKYITDGYANTIRFHFEGTIPKEHESLMIEELDGFMKTIQWSQRPHLTTVMYYKDVVLPTIPVKSFIEDTYHGVVQNDWNDYGIIGWNKHRLVIYYPNKKNIKRSYHLDGRAGGRKFTSDDKAWGLI